jgi:hypothetical protein
LSVSQSIPHGFTWSLARSSGIIQMQLVMESLPQYYVIFLIKNLQFEHFDSELKPWCPVKKVLSWIERERGRSINWFWLDNLQHVSISLDSIWWDFEHHRGKSSSIEQRCSLVYEIDPFDFTGTPGYFGRKQDTYIRKNKCWIPWYLNPYSIPTTAYIIPWKRMSPWCQEIIAVGIAGDLAFGHGIQRACV